MKNNSIKIYLFYCSNSLDTDALRHGLARKDAYELMTISLSCSGKVDLLYLLKAFEKDADGVLLLTCKKGECKFLEGNLRAEKRSQAVDSMLEEIGVGRGRMKVIQKNEEAGVEQILTELDKLSKEIRNTL